MDDRFQSLSKGVFVVPFSLSNPDAAGPSRPKRPLFEVYSKILERNQTVHDVRLLCVFASGAHTVQALEISKTREHLADIKDWLKACSDVPLLVPTIPIHRLPVAIIQNISASLPPLLGEIIKTVHTVHGRDAADLTSAIREIALGFIGETVLAKKKNGRTGFDELERWWDTQPIKQPMLLHLQEAQVVPPHVLSELIYIISLHPRLPLRLILSVPSTTTFLSTWVHIEPSIIDLCILQPVRNRRKGRDIEALLESCMEHRTSPLNVSQDLAEQLRREGQMVGGGALGVLRAVKSKLSMNAGDSPADDQFRARQIDLSIVDTLLDLRHRNSLPIDVPGLDLFEVNTQADFHSTHNPAPRISILHALASSSAFFSSALLAHTHENGDVLADRAEGIPATKPRKSRRTGNGHRAAGKSPVRDTVHDDDDDLVGRGDVKESEILFALWRSAGKTVNLWDWLEGYRSTVAAGREDVAGSAIENENTEAGPSDDREAPRSKRKRVELDSQAEMAEVEEAEGGSSARLHASFIRFCEEARMMGLVRARGKGITRRGDEVVKGMGMV
ncbi:hypothetical protein P7C73_g105, partial [Tremellales sp. Uapishka_1]